MGMNVGAHGGKKGQAKPEMNVTPLVDVVLVLLIIFIVLTPSTLKRLDATVPQRPEDDAPPVQDPSTLVVEYTANRELMVNCEAVAPEALANELAQRLRRTRKKVVFFKAEDEAPYGEVVRLMDLARGSGAGRLAVITEKM